ncbi:MAG TPA: immunity 53 family protein [Opitutaceae bacterium]|mgnify:CR=1 FL=1|nr:immunity 53 family protein [Opitutaceae bacterium]
MRSTLQRLSAWYSQQCNGDWEHGFGFKISTLDNPGVAVDIDLRDTPLETVPFAERKDDYESTDRWMLCRRNLDTFEGRGAPDRLEDSIEEFLRWAESHR